MSILDVGCGPGSISSTLAALVPQGSVIGIDSSETTLEIARSQHSLPANCTFQSGNALDLEFADSTFDVVQTSQVLCHIAESVAVLKEFHRVLKPGGFVACKEGDSVRFLTFPEHPGLELWGRCIREGQLAKGAHPNAGRRLLDWAVEAGFSVERCTYTAGSVSHVGREGAPYGLTMVKQTQEDEVFRRTILDNNLADEKGLELIREGWEVWAKHPYCVFSMYSGQLVAYK